MGRWNVYGEYSSGESMRLLIRDIRGDEKGVASTVGTIMALLVFLTFLSLIVNQYVPVWMKDSEASHMNGALGQFRGIKGAIDLQILSAQASKISGTDYIPEAHGGRGRHGDVVRPRNLGGLRRENLEVDRPFDPAELAQRAVHVRCFGVFHPDGHVLIHDQAEEREEDEEGHDRADGRGDPFLVPANVADQKTHGFT